MSEKTLTDRQRLEIIETLALYASTASSRAEILKRVTEIYMIAHLDSGCSNPHNDWKIEVENLYQEMARNGEIKNRNKTCLVDYKDL